MTIDINKLKEKYNELQAKIKEFQEESQKEARKIVAGVFTQYFESNPKVFGIGWCQYTPYFNDGDECYFGVHDINLYLTEVGYEDYFPYEGDQGWRDDPAKALEGFEEGFLEEYDISREEALRALIEFKQLQKVVKSIEDDYMQMIFGNHVKVLYTKDGVEVEEHRHD